VRAAPSPGRLLAWLHDQAERGWSGPAVFGWGFVQGSVLPGPADVVYAPLALAHPPRALRLALLAAAGSIMGGLVAYALGTQLVGGGDGWLVPLLSRIGITPASLEPFHARMDRWGWLLVLVATVSPLSTKLVCLAAGAFGVPLAPFMAALAGGRTARTVTIALVAGQAGRRLAARLGVAAGEDGMASPGLPTPPAGPRDR
jgi:membrane protein YqaA with SNARE-associated domain